MLLYSIQSNSVDINKVAKQASSLVQFNPESNVIIGTYHSLAVGGRLFSRIT